MPSPSRGACTALATLLTVGAMLGPGARLSAQAPGADSALFQWRQRNSALATPSFAATWQTTPAEFRRSWDAALEGERDSLGRYRKRLTASQFEEELLRLRLRHAWGRVVWPYFHWRESAATEVSPDVALDTLMRTLPLEDERWWSLPEHAALRGALVHERAHARSTSATMTLRFYPAAQDELIEPVLNYEAADGRRISLCPCLSSHVF